MKRVIIVCLLLAASVFTVWGLEIEVMNRVLPTAHYEIHYIPHADGGMDTADFDRQDSLAQEMEERFAMYNSVFHFEPERLGAPLLVRAFADGEEYKNYIKTNLGREQAGAVYLHYDEADICELAFCTNGDGMDSFSYQSFIQFLRAFIPNPPAWMLDGFAVFFSSVHFDEDGIAYEENLAWLNTVKNMKEKPALSDILTAEVSNEIAHFQALAWSLVSFFFNDDKGYYRNIIESVMVLSDTNTAKENTDAVMERISKWNSMGEMTKDYLSYLEVRKTFADLLTEGQKAYSGGKPQAAKDAFFVASGLRPNHYAPWYYLGLLAYDSGDAESAQQHFQNAMQRGAESGLVLYALALNAIAAGKKTEAKEFLRQSAEAEPQRYKEKAEALMAKLK